MSNSEAQEDVLDPSLRVMDPHRYFENLNNLRQRVIESSEFYRSRGQYKPSRAVSAVDLTAKPSSVPTEIWERCEALVNHDHPGSEISKSEKSQKDLTLYMRTYLILSWIVDNLDLLNRVNFCGGYYSLLLEHPESDLAEIIRLPRKMISDFKEALEPMLIESSHETIGQLLKHTEEQCSTILALLGPINIPTSTTRSSGQLFWMTAALLDLALVSYVGSHGLHPGLGVIKGSQFGAEVSGLFGFRCQSSRTTCLNEFFDSKKIWTFHVFANSSVKTKGKLSILGHIEEFADLWGPVWAETVSKENHELIKWYSVSKGYICRVDNGGNTYFGAKRCHWYFEEWIYHEQPRESEDDCLRKDDLLLIGSHLVENENCTFSMDEFAQTCYRKMHVLGPTRKRWNTESRSLTVSISRIVGFQIQVSQKLLPGRNQKDFLLDMWKHGETMGPVPEPLTLNSQLGVEISHCTGNARRVTLKYLMLSKAIRPLLDRWVPEWTKKPWGAAFKKALRSGDPNAVSKLWNTHGEYRSCIADLVYKVLNILHITGIGAGDRMLQAAFFGFQNKAVKLNTYGNEWVKCLCDSQETSAYVFLNETCLECRTPNYPTSICGISQGYTVLQTEVKFQEQCDLSLVKLMPQGLVLAKVKEDAPLEENMLMAIASPFNRLRSRLSSSKVAPVDEVVDGLAPIGGTVSICVQASNKLFSGMEFCRRRPGESE